MEERVYTVPLDLRGTSRNRRAGRAVKEVRGFLSQHLNVPENNVYLGSDVNEAVWARGRSKPPSKLKVRAQKFDDGVVEATLVEG